MDPTALYYALSTIAQCAAALAALIGFLGLWRLDRLREQIARLQVSPKEDPDGTRLPRLRGEQRWLVGVLGVFLVVTLALILAPAIIGIVHVDWLKTRPWTPTGLYVASALLAIAPATVVIYVAWKTLRGS